MTYCGQHKTTYDECKFRMHKDSDDRIDALRTLLGVNDPEPFADLWVTFTDGTQLKFEDIRFQTTPFEPNPIKVTGTTVEVEDHQQTFTILGVRYFSLEHK